MREQELQELYQADFMADHPTSTGKKPELTKPHLFSFRRIANRELYQPSQSSEPEGARVFFRTRRNLTNAGN